MSSTLDNTGYKRTEWVDGEPPAINEENLNKMEQGIEYSVDEVRLLRTGEIIFDCGRIGNN